MSKTLAGTVVFLFAFLVLAGCAPRAGEQEVAIGSSTSLSVSNDRGSVSLIGGSVPDLVFLSYEVHSEDGRATAGDVSMVAGPSGSDFVVSVSTPGPDVWVDLVLGLPSAFPWAVTTGSGDVFLESLSGGGAVQTFSGMVSGGDIAGGVSVVADFSDVHFDMRVEDGDQVTVELGEGSMEFDLPTPTHANLQAATDDGILLIWSLPFDGDLDGRAANGILGNGGSGFINLHTGRGNIDLIGAGELPDA
jgi:hypothetical protein